MNARNNESFREFINHHKGMKYGLGAMATGIAVEIATVPTGNENLLVAGLIITMAGSGAGMISSIRHSYQISNNSEIQEQ